MHPDSRSETAFSSAWPDAAIAAVAARQRTLIQHAQLRALGLAASSIWRATDRGRLFRVHRGVYSVVPATLRPPWAAELAAIFAYGPAAVLSHQTAARLHRLELPGPPGGPIHVTLVATQRRPRRAGIALHSTAHLPDGERHRLQGLPVTSLARTVIDLCPGQTPRGRELLADQALKRSRTKLVEALDRHPGRPGVPALRALVDPRRPAGLTWSAGEERLRHLLVRANVPLPESNVALYTGYTPDLLWRRERLIVEYNSDEWHTGRVRRAYDTTRQNRLTADGYVVLPVTCEQLNERPEEVLVWIVRNLFR